MQGLCASIATDHVGLAPQPFLSEVAFTTYLSLLLGQQRRKSDGQHGLTRLRQLGRLRLWRNGLRLRRLIGYVVTFLTFASLRQPPPMILAVRLQERY